MLKYSMRKSFVYTFTSVLAVAAAGCNDLELPDVEIPGTETSNNETTPADTPPANTPPEPVAPEQIVEGILAKNSRTITDSDLATLAAQGTALDGVEKIDLTAATISSAGLKSLAALPNLRTLEMQGTAVSDNKWDDIGNLTSLERLNLQKTATNDATLTHVARLTKLKHLNLASTLISDNGFAPLTGLSALEELNIAGMELDGSCLQALGSKGARAPLRVVNAGNSKFGYQGFVHLKDFSALEELRANSANVTDGSMDGLKPVKSLKILSLTGNQITDAGIAAISGMQPLEELHLRDNAGIGDRCITRLLRLKNLKNVDLQNTSVTGAGAQKLKKAVPDCTIQIAQQKI